LLPSVQLQPHNLAWNQGYDSLSGADFEEVRKKSNQQSPLLYQTSRENNALKGGGKW